MILNRELSVSFLNFSLRGIPSYAQDFIIISLLCINGAKTQARQQKYSNCEERAAHDAERTTVRANRFHLSEKPFAKISDCAEKSLIKKQPINIDVIEGHNTKSWFADVSRSSSSHEFNLWCITNHFFYFKKKRELLSSLAAEMIDLIPIKWQGQSRHITISLLTSRFIID
jgi:hypothetical protein